VHKARMIRRYYSIAHALGDSSTLMGKLLRAREHFETGIALYSGAPYELLGGVDPLDKLPVVLSWCSIGTRLSNQALERSIQALASARSSSNPYTLAYAESLAGRFHQLRQEPRATQEVADHLYAVSAELGFSYWFAQATCERGGAMAAPGTTKKGSRKSSRGSSLFAPQARNISAHGAYETASSGWGPNILRQLNSIKALTLDSSNC
jgi:adenylate cyclase